MTTVTDATWWSDVRDRSLRNAFQVLVPLLVLAQAGQISGLGVRNTAVAAALAAVATVLKSVAGIVADQSSSIGWQYLERGLGAAAGAALAVLPLDWAGAISLDWKAAATAIVSSVVLSLGTTWGVPLSPAAAGGVRASITRRQLAKAA